MGVFDLEARIVGSTISKGGGTRETNGHGIGARPSGGGGEQEAVYNNVVDLQLQIMERLG